MFNKERFMPKEMKQYGTTLSLKTIDQLKEIAELNRWNDNVVIEVAIERYHNELTGRFSAPTSFSVAEAQGEGTK
jgi:hypothetical protein